MKCLRDFFMNIDCGYPPRHEPSEPVTNRPVV